MSDNEVTYGTGRVKHHDPKSRQYSTPTRRLTPRSVLHRIDAAPLDQGNMGACTGFAAAQWLNCGKNIGARRVWNRALNVHSAYYMNGEDAISLYGAATIYDDFGWLYPPDDLGSSGLGVAKALKASGVIDRYEWTFSFDQFLATLQRTPVLIGTAWTASMLDPNSRGLIRCGYNQDLDGMGGHEYLGIGINWPRQMVRIRNSWGNWGLNGDAYITFSDMNRLLNANGDVVVPVKL